MIAGRERAAQCVKTHDGLSAHSLFTPYRWTVGFHQRAGQDASHRATLATRDVTWRQGTVKVNVKVALGKRVAFMEHLLHVG